MHNAREQQGFFGPEKHRGGGLRQDSRPPRLAKTVLLRGLRGVKRSPEEIDFSPELYQEAFNLGAEAALAFRCLLRGTQLGVGGGGALLSCGELASQLVNLRGENVQE